MARRVLLPRSPLPARENRRTSLPLLPPRANSAELLPPQGGAALMARRFFDAITSLGLCGPGPASAESAPLIPDPADDSDDADDA